MKDVLIVLGVFAWFMWMVFWYISYVGDYPQCMMARDVVTCVEIVKGRNGK